LLKIGVHKELVFQSPIEAVARLPLQVEAWYFNMEPSVKVPVKCELVLRSQIEAVARLPLELEGRYLSAS
jgi:hypothetical protein